MPGTRSPAPFLSALLAAIQSHVHVCIKLLLKGGIEELKL